MNNERINPVEVSHEKVVGIVKAWYRERAISLGDNFPALPGGEKGIKIGSFGDLSVVLIQSGQLTLFDPRTWLCYGSLADHYYLLEKNLRSVEQAVDRQQEIAKPRLEKLWSRLREFTKKY